MRAEPRYQDKATNTATVEYIIVFESEEEAQEVIEMLGRLLERGE